MCCTHGRHDVASLGRFAVPTTWRTPLQKAGDPEVPTYQWLHDIADASAEPVRRAFLEAIKRIRGTIKERELRAALETGSVDAVMKVLGLDQVMTPALDASVLPILEDTFVAAGRAAPAHTPVLAGQMHIRFDISNPNTARVLQRYNYGLIRQISDDSRSAIRSVVEDAMTYGGHPKLQARMIRDSIGLTDKQTAAVDNFQRMLETKDRQALTRALRDKRFDPTLERALGSDPDIELSPEQIDRMVERYRSRMLDARAESISRTTTIDVSNQAQQASWADAADKGYLSRAKVRQNWVVVLSDRTCIYCAAVPLMNVGGVPLGGMFVTPLGPSFGPTLHPRCRCGLSLTWD